MAARSVRCVKTAFGIVVILDHALTLVRVLSCSLPTRSHFGSRQAPQNTAPHCWLLCYNKQRGYTSQSARPTRFAGGAMVLSRSESLHVAAASHAFCVGAARRSVSEWSCALICGNRIYATALPTCPGSNNKRANKARFNIIGVLWSSPYPTTLFQKKSVQPSWPSTMSKSSGVVR